MEPATPQPASAQVAAVRSFTRFYTQRVGILHRHLLGTQFSVTDARVLLEIATSDRPRASEVADTLGLDPAHVSRILKRFIGSGLVSRAPDPDDRRGYRLALTAGGRKTFRDLNARADADVAAMIEPLTPGERQRLVASLDTAASLLGNRGPADTAIVLREPEVGDLGWIIHRHGTLYRSEFAWDVTFEHVVIGIIAGYLAKARAGRDRCWVADHAGEVVGSVFLEHDDADVAKLRLLYVEPAMRGRGLGGQLVDECVRAARRGGYRTLELWTMSALTAARRVYESRGFVLAASEPVRQFGHDLSSLTYRLDLTPTPEAAS